MPLHPPDVGTAPQHLFSNDKAQRTALARQRFFEEGARPTGLVSEAVIQSWLRCTAAHRRPTAAVSLEPVTASRLHLALSRNRHLLMAASQEIDAMEAVIAGTGCRVLLTDASGVVIHATRNPLAAQQPVMLSAARLGVNMAEALVGTNAPGMVIKNGSASTVTGAEHFHDCLGAVQCAAAPIHDIHGRLAAVLDLSIESRDFGFDASVVVGVHANAIENQLLRVQSAEHVVLCFQTSPALLGTPLEAMAGVTGDGVVAWLNGAGKRLMGDRADAAPHTRCRSTENLFGLTLAALVGLSRGTRPQPARLPNGLSVWLTARLQAPDGVDFTHAVGWTMPLASAAARPHAPQARPLQVAAPAAPAATAPATLDAHNRKLIENTLADHGGNLAKTARALGVSRGTLYRRLGAVARPGETNLVSQVGES